MTDLPEESKLEALMRQADLLGVKYSKNISEETLQERVTEALSKESTSTGVVEEVVSTEGVTDADLLKQAKEEAFKLVRVRVTAHDPLRKAYQGELFSVISGNLGTVTKYVQFGVAWHIPQILLDMIKSKEYQGFRTIKTKIGNAQEPYSAPMYAVEVLDPLTEAELENLAKSQLARGAIDE